MSATAPGRVLWPTTHRLEAVTVLTIDAHHHLWDLEVRGQDWISGEAMAPLNRSFGVAELADEARAAGVGACVVVQTVTVAGETPELLALAAGRELLAGVVGWTDLTAPDVADTIAELRELPGGRSLVGIRHQVQHEADPHWLLRPDVLNGLRAVARAGLAYDLVLLPGQLPAATTAAARVPELTFVLDHLGKPPIAAGGAEPWFRAVHRLAQLPNTVCKLSGMVTEADWHTWTTSDLRPYADAVLEAFGPHRLMFGSDWPVCTLAASYGDVLDAARLLTRQLSLPEQRAVFATTAVNTYRLALPPG